MNNKIDFVLTWVDGNDKKSYLKNNSNKFKNYMSYYSLRINYKLFKLMWNLYRKVRYGD